MTLEWEHSRTKPSDWVSLPTKTQPKFYRVEKLGARTWVLRIDGQFIERYRTEVAAKEYAERIADGK